MLRHWVLRSVFTAGALMTYSGLAFTAADESAPRTVAVSGSR